jgi:hypothetical protein
VKKTELPSKSSWIDEMKVACPKFSGGNTTSGFWGPSEKPLVLTSCATQIETCIATAAVQISSLFMFLVLLASVFCMKVVVMGFCGFAGQYRRYLKTNCQNLFNLILRRIHISLRTSVETLSFTLGEK